MVLRACAGIVAGVALLLPGRAHADDRWWVERYTMEAATHVWLGVADGGAVEGLRLARDAVTAVRAGTPPPVRRDALAAAVRRALAAPEPARPPGLVPEGEILRVGGRFDGKPVTRSWRPEAAGGEAARALSAAVASTWEELPPVARAGGYVRAEPVDAERAALLRRQGRLPCVERAEITRHPSVARALEAPGWFAFAPAAELRALRELARGGGQIFVDGGGTFEVTVLPVRGE
jgi:hypothetical protein